MRPRSIVKYAVKVHGAWYPVIQAFSVGSGIPESYFNSHTARRHLADLGLEVRGEVPDRVPPVRTGTGGPTPSASFAPEPAWHSEEKVQLKVVEALIAHGWEIVSQADTRSREPGIDIVATLGHESAGIEVKGFPAKIYADPRRAGEVKPTHPSNQAGHWYAQAVLAAMRLRTHHPDFRSVIALPDFPRYRKLFSDTRSSLDVAGIEVWWLLESGEVEGL